MFSSEVNLVCLIFIFITSNRLAPVSGRKCIVCGWPGTRGDQTEDCHAPTTNSSRECMPIYPPFTHAYCTVFVKVSLTKDTVLSIDRGCSYHTAEATDDVLRKGHGNTRIVAPYCNNDTPPAQFYTEPGWDGHRQDCFCTNDDCNNAAHPQ